MNKRKAALYSITCIFLTIGCFYFYLKWVGPIADKQGVDDWSNFRAAKISGKIAYLGTAHHQNAFKVDNNPKLFIGTQDLERVDQNKDDFYFFPKIGDSLLKRANSDTLFLVRDNKTHWFIYQR